MDWAAEAPVSRCDTEISSSFRADKDRTATFTCADHSRFTAGFMSAAMQSDATPGAYAVALMAAEIAVR